MRKGAPSLSSQGGCSPDDGEGRKLHHLHPLNLPIDQILHVVKHRPLWKLLKTTGRDSDYPEVGSCSFHSSRGHATEHYWALKRHLEGLIQRGYLDEFILGPKEYPEIEETPSEIVD